MKDDMSIPDTREQLYALQKSIGPRADVCVHINIGGDRPLYGAIYAEGVGREVTLSCYADTLQNICGKLMAAWSDYKDKHRVERTRKMALEIIRVTADSGSCPDFSLRVAGFTQTEIDELGADACADADAMASNGPFTIKANAQANAA